MSGLRRFTMAILALGLCAGSCRQRKNGVETPASTGDSGTESSAPIVPKTVADGHYQCTLRGGESEFLIQQCEVSSSQELTVSGPDVSLTAELLPRDYGFSLEGKMRLGTNEHTFVAELFRQGGGNFAAIVSADESNALGPLKLTMVPIAANRPTAR